MDGERAYNDANCDRNLMGIKKIKVEKKMLPKLLPTLIENRINKFKLSPADESFYQQYSAMNENVITTDKFSKRATA